MLCTLEDCPKGMFKYEDTWCFKSEYATIVNGPDGNPIGLFRHAYIYPSGEYLWGDAVSQISRNKLVVEPYDIDDDGKLIPIPDSYFEDDEDEQAYFVVLKNGVKFAIMDSIFK